MEWHCTHTLACCERGYVSLVLGANGSRRWCQSRCDNESVVTHMLSILFQHFHGVIFVLFAHMSRTPINTSLQSSWGTDRLVQGMPTYQSLVWVCVFTPAVRKTVGLPDVIKECVEKGVVCVSEDKTGLEWHTSKREVLWEGDGGDMQGKSCYKSLSRHVFVCVFVCVREKDRYSHVPWLQTTLQGDKGNTVAFSCIRQIAKLSNATIKACTCLSFCHSMRLQRRHLTI